MLRQAQWSNSQPQRMTKTWKNLNKIGVGGGFKQSVKNNSSLRKLGIFAPKSIQNLVNYDQMDADALLQRKQNMFDFNTLW